MERILTGVGGLDELISGGIKQSSITVVAGEAGLGKSILALQFALAGVANGEKVLYVSIEEKKDKFFSNMSSIGFKLEDYEAEGNFIFHHAKPSEIRDFLKKGFLAFEEYLKAGDVSRIVIDSITAFLLLYDSEVSQREALLNLVDKLEHWKLTVLMTSEMQEGRARFNIDYLVDGIIRLYYKKVGKERVRTLEILKMRGTSHDKRELVYRIEANGIILYPNEGVL